MPIQLRHPKCHRERGLVGAIYMARIRTWLLLVQQDALAEIESSYSRVSPPKAATLAKPSTVT